MAKKNIRSQIVRDLLEDKEKLNQQLKESADSVAKTFLAEAVKDSIKNMITEDEDSYDEEEVEDTAEQPAADTDTTDDKDATMEEIPQDGAEEGSDDSAEDTATDAAAEEDDVWNDIEQYKGEDGEYDLTGMDKDSLIRVMKVMGPEDGVRIVKNGNGTLTLTDDETEKEYIIDLDTDEAIENPVEDINGEDETEYEISFDMDESVNEENLGYTDSYVKQGAMTTPGNHEVAKKGSTYSMDKGVPTGTEKPYAGKGNIKPYDEGEIDESECLDEVNTTAEMGPANRGVSNYRGSNSGRAAKGRNLHGANERTSTADNSYQGGVAESIKRKANRIFTENKQLKAILPKMQQRLEEAVVINQSLMNMLSLVTENATTREEKKMMCERFNKVKTREESNALYATISEEFKRMGKSNAAVENAIMGQQLSESKSSINEAPMYRDESLNETVEFMKRLNRIK